MPTISCKHCGLDIEVVAEMTHCPHCQKDIEADVKATTVDIDQMGPDEAETGSSGDTAKTAIAGTAQHPTQSIEELLGVESTNTIDSAGRSPNLADYSATLKPTESAFESVDLSSAIPPRSIATTDHRPGEAQDYRLEEKLGSGSFGVVYRAEQVPLERTVALKMLKPRKRPSDKETEATKARIKSQRIKDRNEFLREAQFTGKLEHPNIVPVHDIGLIKGKNATGNRPFYVMKEIKGDSWQSKLKRDQESVSNKEITASVAKEIRAKCLAENLDILRRVADAIEFSHDKNIIHCDLKPENVMLGEFGEVLVVDWGGAVDLDRRETYRPGGSPAYVSPEMAQYWCDIFLEHKEDSPASREMGKQSDIYLLGAMLFEIVTGNPPHFGLKGEDAYDVMRRATENQIRKHDKWMDNELMQIARVALRLEEGKSFDTVSQFHDALQEYESQRISIEMRDRAEELLEEAKANKDYDAYGKSRFGFEESIEKWEGNVQSKTGLLDARLSCAELALNDQNFDLGIGMLEDPETSEEKTLRKKLVDGKTKRDRRKRLIGVLSILLILGGIGSIGLIMWGTRMAAVALEKGKEVEAAEERLITANKELETAQEVVKTAQDDARIARDNAKKAQDDAEKANDDAKKAKDSAQIAQDEAKKANDDAKKANDDAKTAKDAAKIAQDEATKANYAAKIAQDKAKTAQAEADQAAERVNVLNIQFELDDGDFKAARKLLAESNEDLKSSLEWASLNIRTQPEAIEFLSETSEVLSAAASQDGKRIVLVKNDSVSVHETNDYNNNVWTEKVTGAKVAALSPDGRTLAIGIPGTNDFGRIEIFTEGGKKIELNEAPSEKISDLRFSSNGQQLLCVGEPNAARRSAKFENKLMVYELSGDQWIRRPNIRLAIGEDDPRRGTQPKFTKAEFSVEGKRILVTHPYPGGDAHVYERQQGEGFVWIGGTSFSQIDAATFADDEGTKIVGCHGAETPELFLWDVSMAAGDILPVERLNGRVRSLKRSETTLLTAGDDKEFTLWELSAQSAIKIRSSKGHAKEIDFCTFIPGNTPAESTVISIALGTNPEIMKTDLAKYEEVREVLAAGDEKYDNSPRSIFRKLGTNRVAVAKDNGHAFVKINGENVEWEVSAWRNHVLTRDFLFAQSGRDNFLQYDRKTGAIQRVLRRLSQVDSPRPIRITKFQVSDDGKIALTATTLMDKKSGETDIKEFQVWNLENQSLIKRLQFGNLFSKNTRKNNLPTVALSPDGRYVVAGKVGFVVWSTEPGDDQPIFNKIGAARDVLWPDSPINNIVFCDGGNEFAVSWPEVASAKDKTQDNTRRTGRIYVYQKQDRSVQLVGRYKLNIIQGAFDTHRRAFEPNTLGAKIINGQCYILVRSADSIDLLKLKPGEIDPESNDPRWSAFETIQSFNGAKFASFSDLGSDILILNKRGEKLVQRWNLDAKKLDTINVSTVVSQNFDRNRFASLGSIYESADGSITLQSLRPNQVNQAQRDYNTVTLNEDLSIGALRVLSKPTVEYAAVSGDRAITLEGGSIRYWKLVPNQGSGWRVRPDGVLAGNYDLCQLSPDETKLLVTTRGSGRILSVDPLTGKTLFEVDAKIDGSPSAVAWSKDSNQFSIGFDGGEIRVLNVNQDGAVLSNEHPKSGTTAVRDLAYSEDSSALLAIFNDAQTARIYRQDDIGEAWNWLEIGFSNDQRKIVAGDISEDGNRVITGADTGQLTLWNTKWTELQQDPASPEGDLQQVEQRELLDLVEGYSSEVRFVRFFKDLNNKSQIDVVAAARGEPNPSIWKTNDESDVKFLPSP